MLSQLLKLSLRIQLVSTKVSASDPHLLIHNSSELVPLPSPLSAVHLPVYGIDRLTRPVTRESL